MFKEPIIFATFNIYIWMKWSPERPPHNEMKMKLSSVSGQHGKEGQNQKQNGNALWHQMAWLIKGIYITHKNIMDRNYFRINFHV